ncbi:MAG: 2-amino-4-hydroxy-6-hydroxymethyldihydropteridine diphosphokinase [Deltaproteobacteria bacterium]|nr:2-amino-4-hydroxy-6-hydroxymethyldihydropteridine diphosphokinase [Deltaproteobacteria bacterium]
MPDDSFHAVYIGVGSNVGKREENCRKAISSVAACGGCLLDCQSRLYETEPVGLNEQAWFINGVVRIRTNLQPKALLIQLQDIEQAMGRRPGGPRFGPRVLDLDILFFDDQIVQTTQLQIPHPRLHKRRFVLKPLCDISPELVHPALGQTMQSLLSNLENGGKKVILFQ